ncbi:class I SAM-dependent methyltransferase [Parachitinimonas caeni]|uniref:FkbM family methyltransferase n=1 Tax=Parachitinimonas caeni TaxID=3031301 RepID=A0ABT7E2D8_9NEIS|nr:hypothetical protein [Parachitinimonas caeni]MDK2126483.1 hypothetical protein [Parachitinimonas caeni]
MLERVRCLGKRSRIRDRWDLKPVFPSPTAAELPLLAELASVDPFELEVEGIRIEIDREIDPWIVYALICDAYEHGDMDLLRKYMQPGQIVGVIGAGIGVTAALSAKISGLPVRVIEANPKMLPRLRDTAHRNQVIFDIRHGAVGIFESSIVPFTVSDEFWASASDCQHRPRYQIQVVAISPHQAFEGLDFAICDIEGGEIFLLEVELPLSVRTLLVEIHPRTIGEKKAASVMNAIWNQGFKLSDFHGMSYLFKR